MDDRMDEEIIKLVLDGDIQQFRHLVERHSAMAYKTAFAITGAYEDAQEVMQDAFMKVFTVLSSFEGRSKFSTWFFRIVYHTALNHLEKLKTYQKHIETDGHIDAESHFYDDELRKLAGKEQVKYIMKALELLAADDRLALCLYYLDETPQQQISVMTGWSLASTKVRIHRARTKFEQALETLLANEKNNLL